jgi:hypothetical protein
MGIMRIYIDRRKKVRVSRRKFDLKKLEHPDNLDSLELDYRTAWLKYERHKSDQLRKDGR